MFAFVRDRDLGVDVEYIRPYFPVGETADLQFSQKELVELQNLPIPVKQKSFFLCWTRKEAYIKARGLGMQIPLRTFSVSFTPGKQKRLTFADSNRWKLYSFEPALDFVAAIVIEVQDWRLCHWNWEP
jgi:4'-phosphopantetheinyl transferase